MYKDISWFSLEGEMMDAEAYEVYDGDTFNALIDFAGRKYRHKFRLMEFDSPEMKLLKTDQATLQEEDSTLLKEKALEAREKLADMIEGKIVRIKCLKNDKYGRTLCYVYAGDSYDLDVVKSMLDSGLVFKYMGGKKLTLEQEIEQFKQKNTTQ